jgi:hypothetical protein
MRALYREELEMKRFVAASAGVTALVAGGWIGSSFAAGQMPSRTIEVRVGDEISVANAPIGCRVVRMNQLGGRVVVDCRRAGELEGTYGSLFTAREAVLVRFESSRTAKRVAVGVHENDVRQCSTGRG